MIPAVTTPSYIPSRNSCLCVPKYKQNVHRNIAYSSWIMGSIYISMNTKMNKWIMVWLYLNENEKIKTKLENKDKSHKLGWAKESKLKVIT